MASSDNFDSDQRALLIEANALTVEGETSSDSDNEGCELTTRSGLRWDHMHDMDAFFRRVYEFHQRGGFLCIVMAELFALFQFVFVVCFATFLLRCVNYDILFATPKYGNATQISDAVIPAKVCIANFPTIIVFLLLMAMFILLFYSVKMVHAVIRFREIAIFYDKALQIPVGELSNLTWNAVMARVVEVSKEMNLCSSKDQLDQFDVCQRILRDRNYLIAMINKDVLPLNYNIVFVGNFVYFPKYFDKILDLLFFNSPWALFENHWQLNSDVKSFSKREEMGVVLKNRIAIIGLVCLIFSPVLFMWELFLSFFKYTALLKREPGRFSSRRWSLYARYFLRDYNELDHIFQYRLHAAHKPATAYTDMFTSPMVIIFAKNVVFFAGALLAALIALSLIDEDVIRVSGALQSMAWLTLIVGVVAKLIPDENAVYNVTETFRTILAHIHYCPDHWRGQEHTVAVRNEFANLFHTKVAYCLEELLSPFITPVILLVRLRPRAQDIIDFFRTFTRHVDGVGDVCSLYDVRRHGDPAWGTGAGPDQGLTFNREDVGRHGKTELSLVNFSSNYPEWRPRRHNGRFIESFRAAASSAQGFGLRPGESLVPERLMPGLGAGAGQRLRGAVARMPSGPLSSLAGPQAEAETVQCAWTLAPEEGRQWSLPPPPPLPPMLRQPPLPQPSPGGGCWPPLGGDEAARNTLAMHGLRAQRAH